MLFGIITSPLIILLALFFWIGYESKLSEEDDPEHDLYHTNTTTTLVFFVLFSRPGSIFFRGTPGGQCARTMEVEAIWLEGLTGRGTIWLGKQVLSPHLSEQFVNYMSTLVSG